MERWCQLPINLFWAAWDIAPTSPRHPHCSVTSCRTRASHRQPTFRKNKSVGIKAQEMDGIIEWPSWQIVSSTEHLPMVLIQMPWWMVERTVCLTKKPLVWTFYFKCSDQDIWQYDHFHIRNLSPIRSHIYSIHKTYEIMSWNQILWSFSSYRNINHSLISYKWLY